MSVKSVILDFDTLSYRGRERCILNTLLTEEGESYFEHPLLSREQLRKLTLQLLLRQPLMTLCTIKKANSPRFL